MGKLKQWWSILSKRDKRAVIFFLLVAPLIIGWWGVTRPLIERRESLLRANQALQKQKLQLSGFLERAKAILALKSQDEFKTAPTILSDLETLLKKLPQDHSRPTIHRHNLIVQGGQYPAAELRFNSMSLAEIWDIFGLLAGSPMFVSKWECSTARHKSRIDASLVIWK